MITGWPNFGPQLKKAKHIYKLYAIVDCNREGGAVCIECNGAHTQSHYEQKIPNLLIEKSVHTFLLNGDALKLIGPKLLWF